MNKNRRVNLRRKTPVPESQMVMRFVAVRDSNATDKPRSFQCVIASENPVERYDESRDIVIREVLLMDGIELRAGRSQMPIVDSHDRTTVANVLGSVREMRVEGDELVGNAYFASDPTSQDAYTKAKDGHLTDFSVTAIPHEVVFVERGQSFTTSRGNVIEGPANIVTRWTPTDASICATGADERSVIRRSYFDFPVERNMDEALLQSLVAMGLPEGLTDSNAVLAWVVGNLSAANPEATPEVVEQMDEEPTEEVAEVVEKMDEEPTDEVIEKMDEEKETVEMARESNPNEAIQRALSDDKNRRKEIHAACTKLNIERSFADELADSDVSLDIARTKIIERAANNAIGQSAEREGSVNVTQSEADKFYAAARDGLVQRAFTSAGVQRSAFGDNNPAPGHEDFQRAGLSRIAERFVERMGVNVNRMAPKDIALVALGHPGAMNRYNIQRDAYHSTGSFPNLLLDAANKTLLAGYEEAPYTWSVWARQASSVADFKNINRIRFSEMASPEMVPENHDYPESAASDTKETYKVEKYGSVFTITWETVVNDDMDAISRVPAMQGAACRRKQNAAVYGVLTANANMGDGGALFNTTAQTTTGGHANLAGSNTAITVASLNTAFVSMLTKKGLRSDVTLNIQPAFLIVPAAVSATALQVVGSTADPAAGGSAAGNSNTKNIYGPNGDRPLRVVVDPVLDGNSATAWYLAASPSQVDTVELTFLAGEESPVLENEWDFDKDVYKYKVRQTFGVAPIDYRGLYKNAGA